MSEECSVMEIKRRHWSDDAESSSEKQQRKKMKMSTKEDDVACNVPANTNNSHLPLKIMSSVQQDKAVIKKERMAFCAGAEFQDYKKKANEIFLKNINARAEERLREGCRMPIDVLSMHLVEPCLVFESLAVQDMKDLRRYIKVYLDLDRATPARICYWEALLVVCDWEIGEARKKEALITAMLLGDQPSAELLGEERGLQAHVENLLRGKSHGELDLLQSKIVLQMRSGSANVVEYWGPILECIHICKAKACLKEIHAKILKIEAEGTGSSCSPGLLHAEEIGDNFEIKTMGVMEEGDALSSNNDEVILQSQVGEEIGDNFEMKTMGVVEEGDALSSNNDGVILQSQVYRWHNKCLPREPKYCNSVNTDSEWNNCNKTHYDIIMAHYGSD